MKPILRRRPGWAMVLILAAAFPLAAQDTDPGTDPGSDGDAVAVGAETSTTATAGPVGSEMMPLAASNALILDITNADSRAVAVGERGQVLVSESRSDWRQIEAVPTRANLTAVDAVGDRVWAVGHDGTIVHSSDGGLTWTLQRSDPWHPLGDDDMFDPRQGVPLLDILMLNANTGLAVGAYSLMLRTEDGGATWNEIDLGLVSEATASAEPDAVEAPAVEGGDDWTFDDSDLELEEETNPHLNAITRTGDGSIFIVAERGAAFRSRDEGHSWQRLQLPYEGSMFGVLGYEGQRVLAFGMRGNAFESHNLGETWTRLKTGTELSLMGGIALDGGGAVMVGTNGVVLHRDGADAEVTLHTYYTAAQETPVLSGVLAQGRTTLVVTGDKGIGRYGVQAQ